MGKDVFVFEQYGPTGKLYKYFSSIENAKQALKRGALYLDDPTDYNDPFEAILSDSSGKSKYKMSCFCEEWDSILMWSYYANKHKGVCLEFDVSKLDKSYNLFEKLRPVHYSLTRPPISDSVPEDRARCLLTKAAVWGHEHEWRLILSTTQEWLSFDCISAVYFGLRTDFSQKNISELINLADKKGISKYKCTRDLKEYRIIRSAF